MLYLSAEPKVATILSLLVLESFKEHLFRGFHLSGTLSKVIDTEIEPSNAVC